MGFGFSSVTVVVRVSSFVLVSIVLGVGDVERIFIFKGYDVFRGEGLILV